MYLFKGFAIVTLLFALFAQVVSAGQGGWITLINSTPYEWRLTYSHQYQMGWEATENVASGSSKEFYYKFKHNQDDGAEATYALIDHPTNASFTVQARGSGSRRIEVQYHNGLSSLNNPEGSLIDLGWERNGAVPFILAGDGIDTPFISSNPPVAWMQATLPTIGSKPIREISMPASHDSGASEITRSYLGIKHNVLTQSGSVYQQLLNGARYFDIRPVIRKNRWYTAHLTVLNKVAALGGLTRTIKDIVSDINQFTAEYPGELIILDISHGLDRNGWEPLDPKQWQDLYGELLGIRDAWVGSLDSAENVTTVPISTFIQPGSKSAVIFRIPNRAALPDIKLISRGLDVDNLESSNSKSTKTPEEDDDLNTTNPEASTTTTITLQETEIPHPILIHTTGIPQPASQRTSSHSSPELAIPKLPTNTTLPFFNETRFTLTGSFSNTESQQVLTQDQLHKLVFSRTSRGAVHRSTWILTQSATSALDTATRGHSILGLSARAHRALFSSLWGALTRERFPNLIEVDDVWGRQFAALSMAVNEKFAGGVERRTRDVIAEGGGAEREKRRIWEGKDSVD